jgi:predicted ATPase
MEGKKLLRSIRLKNLLSYGSDGVTLQLEPLNVFVGPNASGKSNLIDAISILAAAPRNLMTPFREGGSSEDWLWKGAREKAWAEVEVVLEYQGRTGLGPSLKYLLAFSVSEFRLRVQRETLDAASLIFFLRDAEGTDVLPMPEGGSTLDLADLRVDESRIDAQQSLLSQLRDPINYPQLTFVSDQFGKINFFRGWPFGRGNLLRKPQGANLPDDFLLEDGSNLGLILNDLQNRRETKRLLLEKLRVVYEGIEDVTTKTQGGTIQIFFHEEGLDKPIPAARLSDGTLHYLCLLTVLLHPDPPPLICIEEPELGLHPDIIPKIAELLLDASKRTQLIVTTHSDILVSALSEVPEAIVVCERDDHGTKLRRLEPDKLKVWLERYSLGDLWAKGEIGGNRW